ncbi:P-II family nitrogen regulator [Natronospora cellulosivora (SeqCode)]
MKEVIAIIRMEMINKTKKALSLEGFDSMNCRKVNGRGKKKVDYELVSQLLSGEEIKSPPLAQSLSEGHRLVPKRMLSIVVNDDQLEKVVKTIININKKGNPGDGKIFVTDIVDTIRVRTGESGEEAI